MSYIGAKDLNLEIAAGRVSGTSSVNKFGRAPIFGIELTRVPRNKFGSRQLPHAYMQLFRQVAATTATPPGLGHRRS
jgi:hypothetical protein